MAVIVDKLFIKKSDFDSYKDVSEHLNEERINAFIREAQIMELQKYIGPELYLLLQDDYTEVSNTFATARLSELFFGKDYTYQGKTVRFHGLQPLLVYFSYARMLNELQLSVTRLGPMTFTESDVSDPTEQAQIRTKVADARSLANAYWAEAEKYLTQNRSTYPEFHVKKVNTGFAFFKVPYYGSSRDI